jgi:histidinol-phosphate phosphatase family protein
MALIEDIQAVFIDRDGTMGGDNSVTYPGKFVLYSFTPKAIKLLKNKGIKVFAFTNQPGIAIGEATEEDFINELIDFGFDKVYICPHSQENKCKCRKPETGLLLKAQEENGIDLSRCIVIGDRWSDMMAAERVNMKKILVLTGAGNETLGKQRSKWSEIEPEYVAKNLLEAVEWILKMKK